MVSHCCKVANVTLENSGPLLRRHKACSEACRKTIVFIVPTSLQSKLIDDTAFVFPENFSSRQDHEPSNQINFPCGFPGACGGQRISPDRSAGCGGIGAGHDRRDAAGSSDGQPAGSAAQRYRHRGAHRTFARAECQRCHAQQQHRYPCRHDWHDRQRRHGNEPRSPRRPKLMAVVRFIF